MRCEKYRHFTSSVYRLALNGSTRWTQWIVAGDGDEKQLKFVVIHDDKIMCDVAILRYLKNTSLNFYDLHQVTKMAAMQWKWAKMVMVMAMAMAKMGDNNWNWKKSNHNRDLWMCRWKWNGRQREMNKKTEHVAYCVVEIQLKSITVGQHTLTHFTHMGEGCLYKSTGFWAAKNSTKCPLNKLQIMHLAIINSII